MIYKGYKIGVRCVDWEQVDLLDSYWNLFVSYVESEKLIGLGMNWTEDYSYFDYALGVIDDEDTLSIMKTVCLFNTKFDISYIEIDLPNFEEWETFKGRIENLKQIYEQEIDCYDRTYDYELEYIDSKGNLEIKIHFINSNLCDTNT